MTRRSSGQPAFSLFAFQDIITSVTGIMILVTLMLAIELLTRTEASPAAQTVEQVETVETSIAEMEEEIERIKEQISRSNEAVENLPSLDRATLDRMLKEAEDATAQLRDDVDALNKQLATKQNELAEVQREDAAVRSDEEKEIADLKAQIDETQVRLDEIEDSDQVFFTHGIQGKETWVVEVTSQGFMAAQIGEKRPAKRFNTVQTFDDWFSTLSANSSGFYFFVKPSGVVFFNAVQRSIGRQGFEFGFDVIPENKKVVDPQNGVSSP